PVDPAAIWVEEDVARARAGVIVRENMRVGELTGLRLDEKDRDVIRAEVAEQDEAIVGRDGRGVGMRNVLACGVGAQRAELLMVLEIDSVDRLAERAVGMDAVGGDARAKVISDERAVTSSIDRDIG